MRRIILNQIVLLNIFFSASIYGQNIEFAASFPTSYSKSVVGQTDNDSSSAYVIDSGALLLFKFANSNPSGLYLADSIHFPGNATRPGWRLDVSGSYVFIGSGDSGLQIISTEAGNLGVIGHYQTEFEARDVIINGNYAYLIDFTNIYILDISDPTNPISVWSHDSNMDLGGIARKGIYLYIVGWAIESDMIDVYDISDPANPIPVYYAIAGMFNSELWISGDQLYVVTPNGGFGIWDISNPPPLHYLGGSQVNNIIRMFADDSYSYIALGSSGICIFDVSNSSNPSFLLGQDTPGFASDIFVESGFIFVADSSSLQIFRFNPVCVKENQDNIPTSYSISQSYPNPFNASTTIKYDLPRASDVSIDIFDILGRKVETLVSAKQSAGSHSAVWNATNATSGVYFYKIHAGDYSNTKRCLQLK